MERVRITSTDYMAMQPDCTKQYPSDKFYFGVAQELASIATNSEIAARFGLDITKEIVLAVVGYYQDVVSDVGLWRTMCSIHRHFYGKWLPIYKPDDNYVESELNVTDLKLLIWYILETALDVRGELSPFDGGIERLATELFKPLSEYYDFAPAAEGFQFIGELELYNPEQAQQVYDFSYWLFWHSYLMKPAARRAIEQSLIEGRNIIEHSSDPELVNSILLDLNHKVMKENPTGPLALYTKEWLHAIVDGKMPQIPAKLTDVAVPNIEIPDNACKLLTEIEKYPVNSVIHYFSNSDEVNSQFSWESPNDKVIANNFDFFARLYGQKHYR